LASRCPDFFRLCPEFQTLAPFLKTVAPISGTPRLFCNLLPQSNLHGIAAIERKEHKKTAPSLLRPLRSFAASFVTLNSQPSTLN
jgi:hypothetical protein